MRIAANQTRVEMRPGGDDDVNPEIGPFLRLAAGLFGAATAVLLLGTADGLAVAGATPGGTWNRAEALAVGRRVLDARGSDPSLVIAPARSHAPDEPASGSGTGVPLFSASGSCLGVLCLMDTFPGPELSDLGRHLLAELAGAMSGLVERLFGSAQRAEDHDKHARARLQDDFKEISEAAAPCDADDRVIRPDRRFEAVWASASDALGGRLPAADSDTSALRALRLDFAPCRIRALRSTDGAWLDAGGPQHGLHSEVLFARSPLPMYAYDRLTLSFLAVNDAALAFYRYRREDFERLTLLDIRPQREHERLLRMIEDPDPHCGEDRYWTHLDRDGNEIPVIGRRQFLTYRGRAATLVTVVDQAERYRAEQELARTRYFLDSVVESVPIAVFAKDMEDEGRYVVYNRAGEALIGRPREGVIGRRDPDIFEPEIATRFVAQDRAVVSCGLLQTIVEETVTRGDGETRIIQTKKLPIPDGPGGRMRYVLGVSEDITERRRDEARISYMAHHDALTDLPNRILFRERLEAAFARVRGVNERLAIHCLDLDNFKEINDSFGHTIGDVLLRAVADRLRRVTRPSDLPARLGGDEFAILQAPICGPEEAGALAGQLIDALSAPYAIEGRHFLISASVGIAHAPGDGTDLPSLLQKADTALYRAKNDGRGTFRFYAAATNGPVTARHSGRIGPHRLLTPQPT